MKTLADFFNVVRADFPDIALKANEVHVQRWADDEFELPALWMESLAGALNNEMAADVPYERHVNFFDFVNEALTKSSDEICRSIDVGLVENLFWNVNLAQSKPYWDNLPASLKELYIGFHGKPPV